MTGISSPGELDLCRCGPELCARNDALVLCAAANYAKGVAVIIDTVALDEGGRRFNPSGLVRRLGYIVFEGGGDVFGGARAGPGARQTEEPPERTDFLGGLRLG